MGRRIEKGRRKVESEANKTPLGNRSKSKTLKRGEGINRQNGVDEYEELFSR